MAAERLPQQNLAAVLVVEALERVAATTVSRRVLSRALEQAELEEIPASLEELTFFVSGPLYEQAAIILGTDFADELLLEMSAALDRAWDHARAEIEKPSQTLPPMSAMRQVEHDTRVGKRSTIRRVRSLAAGEDGDTLPELPEFESVPPQVPSSQGSSSRGKRHTTVPYMQAVFAPPAAMRRLMIVDADDDTRRSLTAHFTTAGYAVVCAQNSDIAHALHARLRPSVVIADIETIAPDFEPLRSAFAVAFGDDVPPVILLSDGEARELPEQVAYVIHRPWSEEALDAALEALLPLDRQP